MTISFSGLASGLDTSSWVESLVKLKQAKIDTLQEEKEGTKENIVIEVLQKGYTYKDKVIRPAMVKVSK